MYELMINGVKEKVEAEGVTVEQGNLLFYCDKVKGLVNLIVQTGKWDSLRVCEGSDYLVISRPQEAPLPAAEVKKVQEPGENDAGDGVSPVSDEA